MDQPDLRQLRYFLAVAEELHFGRAAEKAGIAQPPLTQQIQRLERLLGCTLLIRGRKTKLTGAGAQLAEDARRIVDQAEHAFETARRVARGEAGQLRVGVPPSVMLTRLPAVVRQYRDRYPEVAFTLRELSTSAIETALQSGEIDLGFLREVKSVKVSRAAGQISEGPVHTRSSRSEKQISTLETTLFLTEPVVAVLPADHLLTRTASRKNSLNLKGLAKDPFVFFPRHLGSALYDRLLAACSAAGFIPNVVQEATQWSTVVSLVEAGMGVSLAPACVATGARRGVVFRQVAGITTDVYASWRRAELPSAAAQFLRLAGARQIVNRR